MAFGLRTPYLGDCVFKAKKVDKSRPPRPERARGFGERTW